MIPAINEINIVGKGMNAITASERRSARAERAAYMRWIACGYKQIPKPTVMM